MTKKDWKITVLHAFYYFLCLGLGTGISILLFHSPNMFYAPAGTALLAGWIYLHLVEKVPKFGALTFIGAVISLFFLLSHHYILAVFPNVIFALLADVLLHAGKANVMKTSLAYLVFSLGNIAPLLAMWISRQGYITYLLAKGKGTAYVNKVMLDFNFGNVVGLLATVLFAGLVGLWIGQLILQKKNR